MTFEAARAAGLVGRKRLLDSTPLYDAVATWTPSPWVHPRSGGLLRVADPELETVLRGRLAGEVYYATPRKPVCDYDDPAAREGLVDALARDTSLG